MYRFYFIILLFLGLTTSCSGQTKDDKSVRDAFEKYKSAILNDKGEEASNLVDTRTIRYYDEILTKIKFADSATVNSLSIMDKIMVFSIRHRSTKEEILSFDGKKLFIYAINKGMVGKNSVSNNSIGEVRIEDNFAKGQVVVNGQKTPLNLHFYKEEGQWKTNLTSLFSASNVALKKMIQDNGQDENEYLFELLEFLTGRKPGNEIWQSVK